jgi:hypothetical protein
MYKKFLLIVVFILIVIAIKNFRYGIISTYCEYFCAHHKNEIIDNNFIVRDEAGNIPNFIKHILTLAFPEYNIIYDQNKSPNMVIKNGYNSKLSIMDEVKNIVPYLVYYPEKNKVKLSRYRASGYPLHQFNTVKNDDDNITYIPFIAYSKDNYDFLLFNKLNSDLNLKDRKDIVYIFRHCVAKRDNLVRFFMTSNLTVDSYGKCLNNIPAGAPGSYNDLKNIYSQYKFTIAMEHAKKPGYITEKLINSLEAKTIPIYWGDNSVKELFNKKSYIDLDDFKNNDELLLYLQNISSDHDKLSEIINSPKLTEKGKQIFQINQEYLTNDARLFLMPIALKIRQQYNNWYN